MQRSHKNRLNLLHPTLVYIGVSNWFETHPRAVKHAMHLSIITMLGFTLLNAGVFTVQNGRTSAFTKINGKDYGLMTISDTKKLLESQAAQAELTVSINGKTALLNAKNSGVQIDADKTLRELTDKNGWRKVPVVSAIGNLFTSITPSYDIDIKQLAAQLTPYVSGTITPAKDAGATIHADVAKPVTINPAVPGSEFTAESAADQLAAAIKTGDLTAKLQPKTLDPKWTELDIKAFMPAIESARRTSMTVQAGDKKVTVTSADLAPMLQLNTSGSALKMTLDSAALKDFLVRQAQPFYTAPISTMTVQKDGTEVSRTEGTAGKQLDAEATATIAVKAFENGIATITPAFSDVTPGTLVTKTYSNTDEGLYKLFANFDATHYGAHHIAAVELKGQGSRSAFYKADEKIIPASTYKLFLAYGILQQVEEGTLTMDSPTVEGTVKYCIERMIHLSTNECGIALQNVLGWAAFDKKLIADGFASTKLNNADNSDKQTTARDEMQLLTKLYNRELLNDGSTQYLLGLMQNQVWRSGIPSGSRGAVVADKVGYLFSLTHDIAIVYSPKATYALVVMTEGSSWTNIKLLAQEVYEFYNQ